MRTHRPSLHVLLGLTTLAFAGATIAVDATTGAPPPPAAAATPPAPTPAERFKALDVDADSALSRAEADASPALRDRFDAADTDGSGALSEAEYQALVAGGESPTQKRPTQG